MNILVTGGTGHLGREFVRAALAAGHCVRVVSRKPRPANTPEALQWATFDLGQSGWPGMLEGIEAVVHAASDPRHPQAVDVEGTRRLAEAARGAGVGHMIYVSIVGIDRIPLGYYRHKLAAEQALAVSGVPYSILRATQFHYFVDLLFRSAARVPLVMPIPAGFQVQSVAIEDVAARLLGVLNDGPGGRLPDFGGPEAMSLVRAAELWKDARGVRKPLINIPLPGKTAAAYRAGYNLALQGDRGRLTWQEWLQQTPPPATNPKSS